MAIVRPGNSAFSQRIVSILDVERYGIIPSGMGMLTSNLLGLASSFEKLALKSAIEPAISIPYCVLFLLILCELVKLVLS